MAFLILVPLYFYQSAGFSKALGMFLRLRWFFISILLVYLWLTPEADFIKATPHLPYWARYGPGLIAAAERIFSLVLVIFAVANLLSGLKQQQLLGAIYWLASPLVLFGLNREQLALRLVLTLDMVKHSGQMAEYKERNINNSTISLWNRWAEKIVVLYQDVLKKADSQDCRNYSFYKLPSPDLNQWFYPVLLYLAFMLAGYVNIA